MNKKPLRKTKKVFINNSYNPLNELREAVYSSKDDKHFNSPENGDPLKYFMRYMREFKEVEVIYDKNSTEWEVLNLLRQGDTKRGFIKCTISNVGGKLKACMSLIDSIKLGLIIKVKQDFGLSDKYLQELFLALRYCVKFIPPKDNSSIKHEWDSKIKADEEYATLKYNEIYSFDEALFYILYFGDSVCFSARSKLPLYSISYFTIGTNLRWVQDGILINLSDLLYNNDQLPGPYSDTLKIEDITPPNPERQKKEGYLHDLYDKLGILISQDDLDENQELVERQLMMEIYKTSLELQFGCYDMNSIGFGSWNNDWQKDIEDFLKYNINGEYKIIIKNGRVKQAENNFISSNLSKAEYQKLKDYVSGYGHIAADENAGRVTRYVGTKRRKYGNKDSE